MQEFPCDHAFAQLSGTDNIISFHTKRYSPQPMTIRGPGAGLEVRQQPQQSVPVVWAPNATFQWSDKVAFHHQIPAPQSLSVTGRK